MGTVLLVVFVLVIAALLVVATSLLQGKGAFLIAGYNTMSQEEKKGYDVLALCRFVGILLIAISLCLVLVLVGLHSGIAWLFYGGIGLVFGAVIVALIIANTGNRFRNKKSMSKKPKTTAPRMAVLAIVFLFCVIILAVGALMVYGAQEPTVKVLDNSIQIKSLYGLSIDFSDIYYISLIEKSMDEIGVGQRINGYGGLGDTRKGNFKSDYYGEMILFVASNSTPTICLEMGHNKDIFLSFRDSAKTIELYEIMFEAISAGRMP